MTDSSPHLPKRTARDRLDVVHLLHEGLQRATARCVVSFEGSDVSEADLRARVSRIQAGLRAQGLEAGDRVAAMLSNSVDHIALIYALILSGVVWIPVNVRVRGAGLAYVIEHSRPALLLFDAEFADVVSGLEGVVACRFDAWVGAASSVDGEDLAVGSDIAPSDTLCIIYTSGTTGPPKGVVFTHRMLRIASEAALMVADIRAGDRAFLWEPLSHIGGAQMLMLPFLADAQLHVVERFSATRFWQQWHAARATHLHYLGGVLDVLMQLPPAAAPPAQSIRVAWGAGVSARAWAPIRKRFGCELRECYGMTECSSFATFNASGTPGSIGAPLPWIGLELLDAAGRPVPPGEIGEIVLSSDLTGVFMPGYLDNPDATARALRGGRLHTGDLARQLPNGEYAFVGRSTDSMRVRGENVSAWEVERVFAEHPSIKAAAAIGVRSDVGEQDIFLHVQVEEGRSIDWNDLVDWARPRLATFQLPRYFARIDRFELTPSERIRKHLLSTAVADAWDRHACAIRT